MGSGLWAGVAAVAMSLAVMGSVAAEEAVDPKIVERMAKEKEARRACKLDICKAFAEPGAGAPIECDVTKTWLRDEILNRIVGGSYVWGYGHVQCTVKLKLDRAQIASFAGGAEAKAAFAEQVATCNVDDKDQTKGTAFTVKLSAAPVATFAKGDVTAVSVDGLKTEGSSVAAAAVTSIIAVDKVSGLVSKAAAAELNEFIYEKCKADGITVVRK
jgi:hypothetical protein